MILPHMCTALPLLIVLINDFVSCLYVYCDRSDELIIYNYNIILDSDLNIMIYHL